jgi:hypothetical protein
MSVTLEAIPVRLTGVEEHAQQVLGVAPAHV